MDEARRRIQDLVENGLLPAEQAAFMLDVVGESGRVPREPPGASGAIPTPLLEQRTSRIKQILSVAGVHRIKIDNPLGDLCVFSPSREGIEVEIERQAAAEPETSFEALFRQIRVVDYREGGTLMLRMRAPEAPSQTRLAARVFIAVPGGMEVEGVTAGALELRDLQGDGSWSADGPVRIADCGGGLHIRCDNGDVGVERFQGRLDVHAENGNVRLLQCSGEAVVSCWRGDVAARQMEGRLQVSVQDGDFRGEDLAGPLAVTAAAGSVEVLRARSAALDVQVESGSARIEATLDAGGAAAVQVSHGDAVFLIRGDSGCEVRLDAEEGAARCELPLQGAVQEPGRIRGTLGGGEARLEVASRHGDVRVGRGAGG